MKLNDWFARAYDRPDPAAEEALKPILRTGRMSRFRVLDVACPNNHRLVQVLRTSAGLVVVAAVAWIDGSSHGDEEGDYWEEERHRHGDTQCVRLDHEQQPADGCLVAHCRCRWVQIPRQWIREQIAAGKKRVVWQPETPVR